ncbi:hypothetical protein B0H12DRAFT_1079522 [Mycena haematopus]|nr:hypothetical protein B0H12DRAFT_1079522 [Mycena haematopus]
MTSPTPGNRAADDSKYLALWTPDDKPSRRTGTSSRRRRARHQHCVPVLCLMKREFPEQTLEDVDVVLLDVWYGYTRLLSKLGTGPPDWKAVCIHDSYKVSGFPRGRHHYHQVPTLSCGRPLRQRSHAEGRPCPKAPRLAESWFSSAHCRGFSSRTVTTRTPDRLLRASLRRNAAPSRRTPNHARRRHRLRGLWQPSAKRARTNAVVPTVSSPKPTGKPATRSSARAMTASKPPGYGGSSQSGKTKPSPRNKTSVEIVPDSEEEEAATSIPAKKDGSSASLRARRRVLRGPTSTPRVRAVISSAIVKRQGNRKATGHVGSPLEGKKLTMAELSVITSEVNFCVPSVPCVNCMILGKDCTPMAFGTCCDNCTLGSLSSCQYNKDARYVVDLSRRLGEWTGATPEHFLHLSCGLEEAIEAADAARQVADAAALRVAKYFSAISLSALAIVDKFGPLTLAQCFDDESPEAIANFFNGAIADYNRMHAGAATLKADDFKPVWSSADLVSPGALEALQRELVLTETEAKDSQGKGKGKA